MFKKLLKVSVCKGWKVIVINYYFFCFYLKQLKAFRLAFRL